MITSLTSPQFPADIPANGSTVTRKSSVMPAAFFGFRQKTVTVFAPISSAFLQMERAAPPAPSRLTLAPWKDAPISRSAATMPFPSVLKP